MPKALYAIENVKETVIRPVVFDLVRQVQEWTGLKRIARVLFPGDSQTAAQPASGIHTDPEFNNFDSGELWQVNVRAERQMDMVLAMAVHQMDHCEIFYDKALDVGLRPSYAATDLTLEFTYRATDANTAERWRDEIKTRISEGRQARTHTVSYSYLVPLEFMELLKHIHTLRENHAGYGDTYEAYLKNHFTENMSVLVTQAGTQGRWAASETQNRIIGMFDFDEGPDQSESANDSSAVEVTFSYKIKIDVPIAISAYYPIVIHQQLLDPRYLMIQPKPDIQAFESRSNLTARALGAFEVDRLAKPTVLSGIRIPEFHEFYPTSVPRHTLQVVSAMVNVMPPDPVPADYNVRLVINLNDLGGDYSFREEFLKFLKAEHAHLHRYGESLVNVTLYNNDMPMHHSRFYVDEDLNLIMNEDPSQRGIYYVRIALITDPTVLSVQARHRIRFQPDGLILVGAAVCPDLVKYNRLPKVTSENFVVAHEVEAFFRRIVQCTQTHTSGQFADFSTTSWNTVMILFLETISPQN